MALHHFIGRSVTRTVEIGAVALWYQFVQFKLCIAHKYCKHTILNHFWQKHILLCRVTFWRHNVIEILRILMNFETIFLPCKQGFSPLRWSKNKKGATPNSRLLESSNLIRLTLELSSLFSYNVPGSPPPTQNTQRACPRLHLRNVITQCHSAIP